MADQEASSGSETQQQIDALREKVARNREDIDALLTRADASSHRADASEAREDIARSRADASEARADQDRLRIDKLEARVDIDREMILELQDPGVLKSEHVAQLQEALRTSRKIGAAVGIIMAKAALTETGAFAILSQASQNSNRKLRDIAEELVLTGDTAGLH